MPKRRIDLGVGSKASSWRGREEAGESMELLWVNSFRSRPTNQIPIRHLSNIILRPTEINSLNLTEKLIFFLLRKFTIGSPFQKNCWPVWIVREEPKISNTPLNFYTTNVSRAGNVVIIKLDNIRKSIRSLRSSCGQRFLKFTTWRLGSQAYPKWTLVLPSGKLLLFWKPTGHESIGQFLTRCRHLSFY